MNRLIAIKLINTLSFEDLAEISGRYIYVARLIAIRIRGLTVVREPHLDLQPELPGSVCCRFGRPALSATLTALGDSQVGHVVPRLGTR